MAIKVNRKKKEIQLDINNVKKIEKYAINGTIDITDIPKDSGIPVVENPNFAVVTDPLLEQELIQREKYLKDKEHLKQINKDLKKFVTLKGIPKIQIGEFVIELSSENVDVAKIPKDIREKYLETKTKTTIEINRISNGKVMEK